MQADDALQLVGEMRAPFRLALGEGLMLARVGRGQMVDAGEQRAEELAVVDHAADADAAEADAVIAALAPDQALARAVPRHVVEGERDLQRGVGGLRARIAEEHVVEIARRERGDARRQREGLADGRTGSSARNRAPPPAPGSRARWGRGCGRRCSTRARRSRRGSGGPRGCNNACPWRGRSGAGAS